MGNINKNLKNTLLALHSGIKVLKHARIPEEEELTIRCTIKEGFKELDKNKIPFKLQNKLILSAEQNEDFDNFIKSADINFIN